MANNGLTAASGCRPAGEAKVGSMLLLSRRTGVAAVAQAAIIRATSVDAAAARDRPRTA